MSFDIHEQLEQLGLSLPPLRQAAGQYLGHASVGPLLFLAGQGADGWRGRVGADLSVDEGRRAARDCMLNLLAQTDDALCGDWTRFVRPVKVLGFVACTEDFEECPAVLDGASTLLQRLFGPAGRHPRSAIGAQALPLGFAVEIEMVVEIRPEEH